MSIPEQPRIISNRAVRNTIGQLDLSNLLTDENTNLILRKLIGAAKHTDLAGREMITDKLTVKLRENLLPLVTNWAQSERVKFCTYLLELLNQLSESPHVCLQFNRMQVIESFYELVDRCEHEFFPEPVDVRHSTMRRALALVGLFKNLYAFEDGRRKLDRLEWRPKLSRWLIRVSQYHDVGQPGETNDLYWLIQRALYGDRPESLTLKKFREDDDDLTDAAASVQSAAAAATADVTRVIVPNSAPKRPMTAAQSEPKTVRAKSMDIEEVMVKARVNRQSGSVASREKEVKAVTYLVDQKHHREPVTGRNHVVKKHAVKPTPPKAPPPRRLSQGFLMSLKKDDREQSMVTPLSGATAARLPAHNHYAGGGGGDTPAVSRNFGK